MSGKRFLGLSEDFISFNQLSNKLVVSIKKISLIKSNNEFRTIAALTIVEHSKLASLEVSQVKILINKSGSMSASIAFCDSASLKTDTWEALIQDLSLVALIVLIVSSGKGNEVINVLWSLVSVELEDEISKKLTVL